MVEDVRLAVEGGAPVFFHGRMGGMVPTPGEVLEAIRRAWSVTTPRATASAAIEEAAEEPDPFSLIDYGAWAAAGRPLETMGTRR